jgi:UPF0755 protein
MSNRRPAEPHYGAPTTGALPRSPAERLEPTRPAARARRRRRFVRGPSAAPRGASRIVSGVFTLLLLLMVLAGAAALALQSWLDAPGPLTASKKVVIPKGEGTAEIASRLEREGVISSQWLFTAGYRLRSWTSGGRPVSLKAGEYPIPKAASVRRVIDILVEGKTLTVKVTISEGLTSYRIVELLKSNPDLSGEIAEVPEEGAVLPETLDFAHGTRRQAVIERFQAESRKLADKLWARRQKDLPLKSWREAVILASIVEKETGRNDERERVAAVFVNRLRKGWRLDSDPTIRYGIDLGKTVWDKKILKSEKDLKTAYNTYHIHGLPPTPICNPGRAAIQAVLNPARTKELFFVADGNGGHLFAETMAEHNVNVRKYREIERREREKGKGAAEEPWSSTTEPAAKREK